MGAKSEAVNLHSTMKRLGRAIEILAWAAFFAAAALVLALRFWVLPDIERHRGRIVEAVSAALGQPVRIGAIEARWFGLNPHVRLQDVHLFDRSGREVLVLPAVENRLAWSSLARGRLKVSSLAIEGLRLQVRRDANGALHVAGVEVSGSPALAGWAAALDEIVLTGAAIEWLDEQRGAPPLVLSELNLRLKTAGERHAVGFTAEALGSTVELRALLDGSPGAPLRLSGRLFVETGYTDLAAWTTWIDAPWRVERGHGALRAWLTVAGGEVREATADLALSGLSARLGSELEPLMLAALQGRIELDAERGQYRLTARQLTASVEGAGTMAPGDFELAWSTGPDAAATVVAGTVALEPLARVARSLPLPEAARKRLAELEPRGRLEEARFEWHGGLAAPGSFAARAKFIELAASASPELPGFAGLSGSFDADEAGARIVFATRKGELHLPRVFPQPRIPLDFLNGLVEWEPASGGGYTLRLSSLTFSNQHLSGNARGTYTAAAKGPGTIDLAAQFNRADGAHLDRYLPHPHLMGGEAVRAWLTRSVLAGRSGDVRVRLRGDLSDFPFRDPARGEFSVAARLERGILRFAEGWPRIENIQGELVFERDGMRIAARSASIEGIALSKVEARIARFGDPQPALTVTGQAEGATESFLQFIRASPVRQRTAEFTDPLSASGRGTLHLALDIPLKEPARTRVAGEYRFTGNDVAVHASLPPIERASGRLHFTESSVRLADVQGRLFGGPVALAGATQPEGGARIDAKGEASLAETRILADHPWRSYLSGQAAYEATIHIAKGATRMVVRSALQGVASTLPAPLAKRAADALPLEAELLAGERVKVKLGRILAAEFVGDRAAVAFREVSPKLPERPGVYVHGSLAALDLDRWLQLFGAPGAAAGAAAFDVRIGALDVYGKRLNELAARGATDAEGWSATLASREVAGDLAYRAAAGGRLVARLSRFVLPEPYPGAAEGRALEPRQLPAVDFTAERFTLRGKDIGRVEIRGERAGDDWRIERLAMTNADASFAAKGAWRDGAPTRTELDFELKAANAGLFLARIGYPALVKDGKAELKGRLAWNGDPAAIDYTSLAGAVQLQAESGQFLEIEPGIGKLISLMSLQSLPRRIALDFRDVFSKGFGFERISSSGELHAGVMTVKEFRMRGSSAQVEMSGEVDLAQETQNMRVRVVPSLGDSASTVIALVNPLLAIPAAIAQKILKDPLGHIFAFDYAVTGGWSDPKVAKLGVEAREIDSQATTP
jgi:uncharacterized protein (TIGR02099 family)